MTCATTSLYTVPYYKRSGYNQLPIAIWIIFVCLKSSPEKFACKVLPMEPYFKIPLKV